ncbi:MAG: cyclic nucleotide-binding domain-containing protein [Actinomycetota bacterium]|nr:cyclic nucleotide-binding domain-containing protein [Actinomycetota bacterium]
MPATRDDIIDSLASFSLFADLSRTSLEIVAHAMDEEWFSEGQRILRQGFSGTSFYLIIEGEATVKIDGEERARLGRGDFFGEISILLDEPPTADVIALSPLHCLTVGQAELRSWLMSTPEVGYRMLQTELRRLRTANRWRS